ncbi:metal tolerance protein 4 [Phtheirospermum japonicum]|uniref:Metal tolerance protein 4 n=1 Tax=Phtheirospermum japonicum TaxID=374723 RepID=A0A830CVE9_9LAMI|nr:metal tolerance protein 4 [Phtheirospermum japonicum]
MDSHKDLMRPLMKGELRNNEGFENKSWMSRVRSDFLERLPEKVKCGVDPEDLFKLDLSAAKGLLQGEKDYYERQFSTLRSFEEVDSLDSPNVIDEELDRQEQARHERAMNISNWANVFLLAFKIYATVQSGSLAIAASTLDSLLDLMAGGILWFTHLSMKSINIYKYPIGKLRVQPVGIIIFAAIMATLGEKDYYERQFSTLRSFEEVDSLDSPNVIDEELDRQEQARHERAMNISNWG